MYVYPQYTMHQLSMDIRSWKVKKIEKNRKTDFFKKSKKPLFFVDVETIYPEVQVSNVNSVPTVE